MYKVVGLLACVLVLSLLAACGGGTEQVSLAIEQAEAAGETQGPDVGAAANAGVDSVVGAATQSVEEGEASGAVVAGSGAGSVAGALADNGAAHTTGEDRAWDASTAVQIVLEGSTISVPGNAPGVAVDGSVATITSAGTYSLRGSLADGQIVVDTEDEQTVRLVLNEVDIASTTSAPICVMNAEEVSIILAEGTENYVSDADSYVYAGAEEDEPNAAVFSTADLAISGRGALTVKGNSNDGIASKDGLVIAGGTIDVTAVDDGLRGKDYVVVEDGTITVNAQGDGLKADNDEDASLGYILIVDGTIAATAAGDAVEAQTDALIAGGHLSLSSGGGSSGRIDPDASAKGIKAAASIAIDGGTLTIDAADDAIHSNGSLVINDGTFIISSGDDAMHADATLEVNGGQISIVDSFEGLESAAITINDGQIQVIASDDGLNVAGGNDGSGMNPGPGLGGGAAARPGRDAYASSGTNTLDINGGTVAVHAAGDGIDVNGSIQMTGGLVVVHGPTENMNGALDYDRSFALTGGLLVAAGSSGMAQAPDESSTQYSVLLNLDSAVRAGTLIHIQDSDGDDVLTFAPAKDYQSIVFSSPELEAGATYYVSFGGSSTGTAIDGLYQGGTYDSGSQTGSFALAGIVTRLGRASRR